MIEQTSMTDKILSNLDRSPFRFHATGSRFIGGFHVGSDYDYFVENSNNVIPHLRGLGFTDYWGPFGYNDSDCVAVLAQGIVHVQVVRDVQGRLFVRNILRDLHQKGILRMDTFNKMKKTELWDILLDYYRRLPIA